jgi:pimeloyl-ACP methyl ester carboxylesterase
MPSITVNGSVMHYLEQGKGRALVMVHGFPLDSRMWEAQVSGLSDQFRVIAPDLPGFGQSPGTGPFTMDSVATQLNNFLDVIGVKQFVLAGLSMGGYVTLAFLKKCPRRLDGVVLLDTRAEGDTAQGKEARMKMIDAAKATGAKAVSDLMLPKLLASETVQRRPELVRKLRQMMESQKVETIERALLAMRDREDYTDYLPSIADPTLIVVGDNDAITPPAMSEAMHRAIRTSELVIVKGSGHMSPMEQPEQVNQAMRRFLQELPS